MKLIVYMLDTQTHDVPVLDINNARILASQIISDGFHNMDKIETFYPSSQIIKVEIINE